jgi:acetyl esterase/lipase
MTFSKFDLSKEFPALGSALEKAAPHRPGGMPVMAAYLPDNYDEIDLGRRRASVLVCPGGAYRFTSNREAEPIAMALLPYGFNVFVLYYDVAPVRYPAALLEAGAAVAYIRSNAEKFNADPDKIAVCGFSAGGHLTASLGVFWKDPLVSGSLSLTPGDVKPNALILGYPVITSGEFTHRESIDNLLGSDAPKALVDKMSLETQVTSDTPASFIWHTFDDELVPVENSLLFSRALRAAGVPFELHIFPHGPHGLSLASFETSSPADGKFINGHCAQWLGLCAKWLRVTFG